MKILIVTQARIGSSRFPAKVLSTINGKPLLSIHLSRLKKSKLAKQIIVATTFEEGVSEIKEIAIESGVGWFQGDLDDVLDRFYHAAKPFKPEFVVRVTSDCPLIDAKLLDEVIEKAVKEDLDYIANTTTPGFPDGQDVEVFKWGALESAWKNSCLRSDREHVTPWIRKNTDLMGGKIFKASEFPAPYNYCNVRMTVDEPLDKETIEILIKEFGFEATWREYADFIVNNPKLFRNQEFIRNEGYIKSLQNDN